MEQAFSKLLQIKTLLPYNPKIFIDDNALSKQALCRLIWPEAEFSSEGKDLSWPASFKTSAKAKIILFPDGTIALHPYFDRAVRNGLDCDTDALGPIKPYPYVSKLHHYLKPHAQLGQKCSLKNIERAIMINLDERPDKWKASVSALKVWGIMPERFSAINGWSLPQAAFDDLGFKTYCGMLDLPLLGRVFRGEQFSQEMISAPGTAYFCLEMTRGALGCLLSHLSVLDHALQSSIETLWVLEDDIAVSSNPNEIDSLIEELDHLDPHWDGLFTDPHSLDPNGAPLLNCRFPARPDLSLQLIKNRLVRPVAASSRLAKSGMRYGAYSLILKRTGIKKIFNYYLNHSLFFPYDWDYNFIPNLNLYASTNPIVTVNHKLIGNNLIKT